MPVVISKYSWTTEISQNLIWFDSVVNFKIFFLTDCQMKKRMLLWRLKYCRRLIKRLDTWSGKVILQVNRLGVGKWDDITIKPVIKSFFFYRFLSDEDDDVSEGVFEFCHSYLGLLKQLNGCNPIQSQDVHVKEILGVILKKMKYDEDYNFDSKVRS